MRVEPYEWDESLYKTDCRELLLFQPGEDIMKSQLSATWKGTLSIDLDHASTLRDHRLTAVETMRNKTLLFTSHPVCGTLLYQPKWTKMLSVQ